jgi:tRNA dimethylallyltransferase
MVKEGLIDEVAHLEQTYGRAPNSMKSIGIVETLEFLDGKISKETLETVISTHTAQLAKRQQTFNTHQFQQYTSGSPQDLYAIATEILTRL